jgi:uncharacterized membrane protein
LYEGDSNYDVDVLKMIIALLIFVIVYMHIYNYDVDLLKMSRVMLETFREF